MVTVQPDQSIRRWGLIGRPASGARLARVRSQAGSLGGVRGQPKRVVEPPLAGGWPAVAGTVGLPGGLHPEERVGERIAGDGGGRGAESAAGWVAPGVVGCRALAVAAGVDNEVRAAGQLGDLLAVRELVCGPVEVRDVERESAPLGDTGG